MNIFDRLEILIGTQGLEKLSRSHVCIFGLGGVGAAAAMDLVRSGIGTLTVFDFDTVQSSNLNRLYFGYRSEIGKSKTQVFMEYAKNINPTITIHEHNVLVSSKQKPEYNAGHNHSESNTEMRHSATAAPFETISARDIPLSCDFYLDCIDTLAPKLAVLSILLEQKLPFASSMGTGGRLCPELLKISSIWETRGCPLAQRVRTRLRKFGFLEPIKQNKKQFPDRCADFLCVWSDEPPVKPRMPNQTEQGNSSSLSTYSFESDHSTDSEYAYKEIRKRGEQGSSAFVPQTAGHMLASLCVRKLLGKL
ncbi:MAG TPA: ThiF family adenylyltransferase [Spirochaetia bacterium]|nr:ThiF family adenylyltransferase [Spirochaetales bacterium]HQG40717.1 ThiF family adenylyltransferase [Spirochaetales bacterium]HQK35701.1 ThiF family adenylyltransferase [Spirochaetales bacterium]HRS65263.1 ThiF family adenylyltransferase [Spirochaetia bacterium]HRV29643.1 ThiF family adenylyltransferase [Spirochaetia bacterium]